MVSFKDFILVEDQKNFDVYKFYNDCKPFLDKIRGIKEENLPKHGSKAVPSAWKIKRVTSQEKPRNYLPVKLYSAIDNYFKERFGWRARSQSILTTGEYNHAARYGLNPVALCFPIGNNFQTLWSNQIVDLNDWYYHFQIKAIRAKYRQSLITVDRMMPSIIEEAIEKIKNMKWHYNENLKEGYKSGHEVLVNADKVYLINYDFLEENNKIIDYLKLSKVII